MARQISSERQGLFYFGTLLIGVGALCVVIGFLQFASGSTVGSHGFGSGPPRGFLLFISGGVLISVGQGLRTVGRAGLAGSGLTLDPQQAREDLEPHARMAGGLIGDAIDESGLVDRPEAEVMVRCRECRELNDEAANFCQNCGKPL